MYVCECTCAYVGANRNETDSTTILIAQHTDAASFVHVVCFPNEKKNRTSGCRQLIKSVVMNERILESSLGEAKLAKSIQEHKVLIISPAEIIAVFLLALLSRTL